MIRNYFCLFISFVCLGSIPFSATYSQSTGTSCDIYFDSGPITRATSFGEEQVVNGVYQAVAQQYNGLSGQITSVIFWARANPASGSANNTLKVVIYNANLGLPGTILGSQNVVVDSSSSCYPVHAIFSSPVIFSGNVIISIEPFAPATDNFYVQHNTAPDGQLLYLNKLKQANQWFKDLAAGDPAQDYDFMILPVTAATVTAGFTYNQTGNTTNFTNTSINASSYYWDFGDGDTSTSSSPSHNYAATGTYQVKLKGLANSFTPCEDSVTQSVSVVITGLQNIQKKKNISLISSVVQDILSIESGENYDVVIRDILGNQVARFQVRENQRQQVNIDQLKPGVYILNAPECQKSIRFIKIL
jgi:PKD repeat protein